MVKTTEKCVINCVWYSSNSIPSDLAWKFTQTATDSTVICLLKETTILNATKIGFLEDFILQHYYLNSYFSIKALWTHVLLVGTKTGQPTQEVFLTTTCGLSNLTTTTTTTTNNNNNIFYFILSQFILQFLRLFTDYHSVITV
jgi:hypothetical protein